jgi:amino acid transporter
MKQNQLKREITLFGAFSTVMGTVIGAGVFFKTASVVSYAQSPSLTIFAWALGGILTICAGLTSAELATAIPKTGGAVKYIEYIYGKLPGFYLDGRKVSFISQQILRHYPLFLRHNLSICFTYQQLFYFRWLCLQALV